jgi:hypothetical protein
MRVTGSGEVHKTLGSLKLPRRLDCLPVPEQTRFRKLGCRQEIAPHYVTSMGRGIRPTTTEPEYW